MKILLSLILLATTARAADADLDRLAQAVAVAETGGCTKGMAVTKNNCHGIMTKVAGRTVGRTFSTTAESFAAFRDLWTRKYGGRFPTLADAVRYTGNDRAASWLATVRAAYSN